MQPNCNQNCNQKTPHFGWKNFSNSITSAYKSVEKATIDGTQEIEVEVSDFEKTRPSGKNYKECFKIYKKNLM